MRTNPANQWPARLRRLTTMVAIACLGLTSGATTSGQEATSEFPAELFAPIDQTDPMLEGLISDLDGIAQPAPPIDLDAAVPSAPEPSLSASVPSATDAPRFWRRRRPQKWLNYVQADYLLWWADESELPSLLTTDPAGTAAGDVGRTGATTPVIDGQTVGDWAHSGIRLRLGRFTPQARTSRFEIDGYYLFEDSDSIVRSSDGSTIYSRPFINAVTGTADSQIISHPDVASGSFRSEYSRQIFGVDPTAYFCLGSKECRWLEFATGYRFLQLQDELNLEERSVLEPGGLIAPNSGFNVRDTFTATNQYHLWQFGLSHTESHRRWLLNLRGNLGFGVVRQIVDVDGQTDAFVGNTITNSTNAGLLALRTNRGEHDRTKFRVIPEINLNLKRQLGDHLTAHAGYSVIFLGDVVRAVDHVPTVIDPRNIPVEQPGAGSDPEFKFVESSLLLHGLNFGLRYDY